MTYSCRSLLPFLFLLAGCVPEYHDVRDTIGGYNSSGGASRANSRSAPVPPLDAVRQRALRGTGLHGGIVGVPLELEGGRYAVIVAGEGRIPPSLVLLVWDSVAWRVPFDPKDPPYPSLAADSLGTIYTITGRGVVRAVDGGRVLWERQVGEAGEGIIVPAPLLALSDGVIATGTWGAVVRLDRQGKVRWRSVVGAGILDPPAATPSPGIVLSLSHNDYALGDTVVALDPASGRRRWERAVNAGRIVSGPALVGDRVYIGVQRLGEAGMVRPALLALDARGSVVWERPLPFAPRGIAGDTGIVVVACSGTSVEGSGGMLVAFQPGGGESWRREFETGLPTAPALNGERLFLLTRREGRTGLFTISRSGAVERFTSLDRVPDARAAITLTTAGELLLPALDLPALIVGG